MAIEVSYEPTFRDFLAMNRRSARRLWRAVRCLSVVMIAFYLAAPFLLHGPTTDNLHLTYSRSLAILILPAVFFILVPANLYLAAKKRWNAVPEIREPRRFVFSEDGITVEGGAFSGRVAWSHVTGADAHRGLVILKTDRNVSYLFSERGFPDDARREAFLSLVRRKVSPTFGRSPTLGRIRFLEPGRNLDRNA